MKKLIKSERGQGLVEFALTLPLLLTILCGIFDFCWIYSKKYEIEHAAFEGARYATIYSKEADVEGSVKSRVLSLVPGAAVDISMDSTSVTVSVTKEIPLFTYVASTFLPKPFYSTSTVTASLYT